MTSKLFVNSLEPMQGNTISVAGSDTVLHAPGHVVQVVQSTMSGNITTSSSSAVATGLERSFTPKFSTSLIQVQLLSGRSFIQPGQQLDILLYKDGSRVNTTGSGRWISQYSQSTDHHHGGYSGCYFETAGSTSSRTYQVYFDSNNGTVYFNNSPSSNAEYKVYLVVTEIAQ